MLLHSVIFTLVSIVVLSIHFMLNILPTSIRRPALYPVTDVCDLLSGSLPFQQQQQQQQRCKKRTCLNVIPDAYIGKWKKRNKLTKEDTENRKKMDIEIRLKMKVQFPGSLVRNDSRFEFLFYILCFCCSCFVVYFLFFVNCVGMFVWRYYILQSLGLSTGKLCPELQIV